MAASKSRMASSRKGTKGDKKEISKDEDNEIPVPQLAWKILDASTTDKLMNMNAKEQTKELADVLKFENCEFCLKESSQIDIYVTALWFARENQFSSEQCSSFFTILHTLLENIKDKHMTIDDNLREVKQMMKNIGISKQTQLQCFTVEVADKVLQYLSDSLFQHYHLYEFLLTGDQEYQDSMIEEVNICLPPPLGSFNPAPLEEAVPEDFYTSYISPPEEVVDDVLVDCDHDGEQQSDLDVEQLTSILSKVDHEEVKSMMNMIALDTVSAYKAQIEKTLQTRETDYVNKLEKLSKAQVK